MYKSADETITKISDTIKALVGVVAIITVFKLAFKNTFD